MNAPVMSTTQSTQLLISVTSIAEAKIALDNGADIIDVKDPSTGALGALATPQIKAIVSFVHEQNPINKKTTSATIGDIPMQPQLLLAHVLDLVTTGVDIIKIGFFDSTDYQPCLDVLATLTQSGTKLMAVLFAEKSYPEKLVQSIKVAGFMGVMLDTAQKNGLTLLDYYSLDQRMAFAQQVLRCQLQLGLAGSLQLQHIAIIKPLQPCYIGFRGGVCHDHQRQSGLDANKIQAIRKML